MAHAVKQILATASYWADKGYSNGSCAALIVSNQYPRFDTKIQKAMHLFTSKHGGPLHVVTKNYEFYFERVLSFQGPHRSQI